MSTRNATITFECDNENMAKVIIGSLMPELTSKEIPRTNIELGRAGARVTLKIKAADINALRAALNSYLKWIKCIVDMVEETANRI